MNRSITTISILSLGTVACVMALSSQVNAQTTDSGEVQMTSTVDSFCTFDGVSNGTLGVSPSNLTTLSSAETANGITAADGAAGSIDVICNDAARTINISSVTNSNTATPVATVTTSTTTVSGLGTDIVSTDGAAGTPVAVGSTASQTLTVNLTATYDANLTPGDYTFTVNLVAAP